MKILIAEDDLMLADFLEEALIDEGHDVCGIAANVRDAVALAREHQPDVAVIDMVLRDGELGTDIATQLAESADVGFTGILYSTGGTDRVLREASVGHACIHKPYSLTTLYLAIEIVLDMVHNRPVPRDLPDGMSLLATAQACSGRPAAARHTQSASPDSVKRRAMI